jgi:uroporphyrinogen III methyltransferase/synthase
MPDERDTGLAGRRIVVTRPRSSGDRLPDLLTDRGAVPLLMPALVIEPPARWDDLDHALANVHGYDWLAATSANAVGAVAERMRALGLRRERLRSLRTAAVGPATAAALSALGAVAPVVADEHTASALAHAMPGVSGTRVFFPCGDLARKELPSILRQRGAEVHVVVVYRSVPAPESEAVVEAVAEGGADGIVFSSPSAVHAVFAALTRAGVQLSSREPRPACFCIGPVTAGALRGYGLEADVTGAGALEEFVEQIDTWYLRHVAV